MKAYTPRYNAKLRKVTHIKKRANHSGLLILLFVTTVTGLTYYNRPQAQGMVSPIAATASEVHGPEYQVMQPAEGWEGFLYAAHKVATIYDFPVNVVLAQAALESNRGNSNFAKERNNYLGIGAFDSNPDLAYHFENSEQCVIEYMRIIRKNFPEAWANRDNPEKLLYHLKHNEDKKMYATDPNYIQKVMSMREWKY